MPQSFDPEPLQAFFKEVEEQFGVKLQYLAENHRYPIQLENTPEGISNLQCSRLLEFIEGQVDLREGEVGSSYPAKTSGKMLVDISLKAAQELAKIYALSSFYEAPKDEENS